MTDDDLHHQLEQASGNTATARAIKSALERLKTGTAGPDLAEMARDLLDGHIQLRDIGQSSAYANPLADALDHYQQWQADLTDEERQQHLDTARAQLGQTNDTPTNFKVDRTGKGPERS